MTVAEMIKALSEMPQDAPVRVEAYIPDGPDHEGAGAPFIPNHVEAFQNEEAGLRVVIWAQIAGELD